MNNVNLEPYKDAYHFLDNKNWVTDVEDKNTIYGNLFKTLRVSENPRVLIIKFSLLPAPEIHRLVFIQVDRLTQTATAAIRF